ncbi:MAG TPA: AraC family transcriptional regulator [Desulfobacteraceae bacterium]|nr:AraC family transcriptional regulator [Desulfobacteraceae bacterium]
MTTRHIGQIIYEGAQILDITGPMEVFSQAQRRLRAESSTTEPAYQLHLIAEAKGPVRTSSGLSLVADHGFGDNDLPELDTLLVAGGAGADGAARQPEILTFIRSRSTRVNRLASVCTGATILAAAGVLNGRRATTHWSEARELSAAHPEIQVVPDSIFVKDGQVYTSAGVTAGIDLALALVEEDYGRDLSLFIAKQLVVFMKRQGGQSQFSSTLARQTAAKGRLGEILGWMEKNPSTDLSVDALSLRCAMSQRNFSRTFKKETGMTPGKFVEKMRVELAAQQIETRDAGFKEIARDSGFKDEEMMRRAFKRQLNVLPHLYRKRFGQ